MGLEGGRGGDAENFFRCLWVWEVGGGVPVSPRVSSCEGVACVGISENFIVGGGSEGTVCIWKRRVSLVVAAPPGTSSSCKKTPSGGGSQEEEEEEEDPIFEEVMPELLVREFRAHTTIVRALFIAGGACFVCVCVCAVRSQEGFA